MGAKKDINRVRELIFGKDMERFEKQFDSLNESISTLGETHLRFEKNVQTQLKQLNATIETLKEKQLYQSQKIDQQQSKTNIVLKEMDKHIQVETQKTEAHLKTLKTELKMYIKTKLNGLDHAKISHAQLSDLFASLSHELKDVDNLSKHA